MRLKLLLAVWVCTITAYAQETYRFDFTENPRKGYIGVDASTVYNDTLGYGFDFGQLPSSDGKKPFFFSVNVPDGNYKVTVKLGSPVSAGETTCLLYTSDAADE